MMMLVTFSSIAVIHASACTQAPNAKEGITRIPFRKPASTTLLKPLLIVKIELVGQGSERVISYCTYTGHRDSTEE
eukprot:274217-Chlamydomonas_euryale.AAC.6